MFVAPSVSQFNADKCPNIARNSSAGLSGYEVVLIDPTLPGVNRPSRTFHKTWAKVQDHLDNLDKSVRKVTHVYDLNLRARVA